MFWKCDLEIHNMGILFSKLEYIWVRQNMIHCEFLFTVSPGPAPGPGVAGTHCDAGPANSPSLPQTIISCQLVTGDY